MRLVVWCGLWSNALSSKSSQAHLLKVPFQGVSDGFQSVFSILAGGSGSKTSALSGFGCPFDDYGLSFRLIF
jgi:hypothetical protein